MDTGGYEQDGYNSTYSSTSCVQATEEEVKLVEPNGPMNGQAQASAGGNLATEAASSGPSTSSSVPAAHNTLVSTFKPGDRFVLYFPIGSMHWNIREQPRPQARLMASARNGRVIVASALVETDGELWLGLAEGGWVRLRHHQFMADHFGTRHEYGWFPEQEMSSAQARANQRTDAVPVPLDMVMGSAAGLGFAMMLPNDPSSVALMRTAYGP